MNLLAVVALLALAPWEDGAGARHSIGEPVLHQESVALRWNETALEAIRRTRPGPTMTARALAIVHTCMFDAGKAAGSKDKQEAVSFAAYRALVDLYPTERPLFDGVMSAFGYDSANTSVDTSTAAGTGNAACAAVLAFRHHDGSNQLGDLNGGAPYSDYTGYAPMNTPDVISDPNRWQPIRFSSGAAPPGFLTPHWDRVVPFAITDLASLRPPPPALYPDPRYLRQAESLYRLRPVLSDLEKTIAEYWSDGPSSELPPGHWNLFAQVVSRRDRHTLDQDLQLFFALNNALLDASIAVWECKRFYDYVRPITAIRFLFDPAWKPYQLDTFLTPPFAEYVSGHSTFSAAAAEVLKQFTGSDTFNHGVTLLAGSSRIEPGRTPRKPVTLFWPTFSAAADEAGLSRRFGGIHFKDGDLEGRTLGRTIGTAVWQKARALFGTGASSSPGRRSRVRTASAGPSAPAWR